MKYFYLYLIIINILALIVTVHDKNAAQKLRRRVSERMLLFIAALGGSPVMYLTMLTISHKTRKPRFMIGIPVIFILQVVCALLVLHYAFRIF